MRVPLVILIAVVQVAGPWLCCCGPARVSAAVVGKPASTPGESRPAPKAGGCPHCRADDAPKPPPPADPTPAPIPVPDTCPCGGVELVAVPADRSVEAGGLFPPAVDPAAFAAFSSPVTSLAVASVPGLRELPNLTVHDRLFKHHVLRC